MKISFNLLFFFFFINADAQVLVLPGDHPDPSVVKIGDTYWSSSTTSNWFPAFPLMQSKDLLHWKQQAYVFTQMPSWADYYFWAPEISYDHGKVYIYYAAHKKNGNLCVAVASADKPEGPFKDHGPLVCQEDGSIDAFPMRDENGKLFLIWKEDANSIGKPTPIWIQEMNEDRTALLGEKRELFRNNVAWESNLVEGVSMTRHGDYFYAFYAGAGCCGAGCSYAEGIARSKSLMGPWEKYSGNPVLKNLGRWTCPGHGTPIEKDGHYYFLFHAYDRSSNIFTGRQGLLMEYRFTTDNWIEFLPSENNADAQPQNVSEKFKGHDLSNQWQWTVFQHPSYSLHKGMLWLEASQNGAGSFIGQKIESGNYIATINLCAKRTSSAAGLAAIGDENNLLSVLFDKGRITIVERREGKSNNLLDKQVGKTVMPYKKFFLRMEVRNSHEIYFLYSLDGKNFTALNDAFINGTYLPPWDRAVRVGLISSGNENQQAVFNNFDLTYQ
ncbi:MAG: family 43 glycosylhydrolase [Flavisolibacter sp.]